jgi:hypothetical protein
VVLGWRSWCRCRRGLLGLARSAEKRDAEDGVGRQSGTGFPRRSACMWQRWQRGRRRNAATKDIAGVQHHTSKWREVLHSLSNPASSPSLEKNQKPCLLESGACSTPSTRVGGMGDEPRNFYKLGQICLPCHF